MRIEMVFGSDSDQKKIEPGIIQACDNLGIIIEVHYASADNSPQKVDSVMRLMGLMGHDEGRRALVGGAGMSNVLSGVMKGYARPEDIVIGIPISDSQTGGISSFYSTSEKPPGNPVFTVGIDNTYAAANIAKKFLDSNFENDIVLYAPSCELYSPNVKSHEKISSELENLGIKSRMISGVNDAKKDSVVLTVFSHYNGLGEPTHPEMPNYLSRMDDLLSEGQGIQIAVREKLTEGPIKRPDIYAGCLDGLSNTGCTSIGGYRNAAYLAAVLTGNTYAIGKISEAKVNKGNHLMSLETQIYGGK